MDICTDMPIRMSSRNVIDFNGGHFVVLTLPQVSTCSMEPVLYLEYHSLCEVRVHSSPDTCKWWRIQLETIWCKVKAYSDLKNMVAEYGLNLDNAWKLHTLQLALLLTNFPASGNAYINLFFVSVDLSTYQKYLLQYSPKWKSDRCPTRWNRILVLGTNPEFNFETVSRIQIAASEKFCELLYLIFIRSVLFVRLSSSTFGGYDLEIEKQYYFCSTSFRASRRVPLRKRSSFWQLKDSCSWSTPRIRKRSFKSKGRYFSVKQFYIFCFQIAVHLRHFNWTEASYGILFHLIEFVAVKCNLIFFRKEKNCTNALDKKYVRDRDT